MCDEYLCTGGAYRKDIVELASGRLPGPIVPFVLVFINTLVRIVPAMMLLYIRNLVAVHCVN